MQFADTSEQVQAVKISDVSTGNMQRSGDFCAVKIFETVYRSLATQAYIRLSALR
jgi:hypothetical protein